jgi:4-amino-4-deoxy-L-arabinose transferase-like glycosyltransferase
MLGYIVIAFAIAVILGLLFVATIPIAGSRVWRRFWAMAVLLTLVGGVLAIAVYSADRPQQSSGWYVVINESQDAVIAQLESPGPYNAWLVPPGEFGPFATVRIGRTIGIYSAECELIGRSRIEGRFRGTVVRPDRSLVVIDLGDMGAVNIIRSEGCLNPPSK